jgi:phage tail sheath gpL-like
MPVGNIKFNVYPTTNRAPGVFAEVDASKANTGQANQRALIIGQILSSGTYTPNVPVISSGYGDAVTGAGSGQAMLAQMISRYRMSDTFGEVWVLPVSDNAAGAFATGTITLTGPATAAGTLNIYIGGQRVQVAVNIGDTATVMGANLVTAMAALGSLAVNGVNAAGVVTLTAVHKGQAHNDIDLRLNYLGQSGGEYTPAGVTVAFVAMSGGASNPVLTTALANVSGDQTFDFIVCPYNDATSLTALAAFLNDQTGRWSWTQELFGGFFYAFRGTFSALTTQGVTRNDQHEFCMGFYDSPDTVWDWATDVAANCAVSLRANPATPLQTLALTIKAPPVQSRFTISQRNTLYYDGMSSYKVDDSGTVRIDRMVTTYQTTNSVPDSSYLDVETMYTLQYVIRDFRTFLSTTFARSILVADGSVISAGAGTVTSQTVLQAAIARYRLQAQSNLVQNPQAFAQAAQGQNAGNGLVKLLLPIQIANQLRQIAMLIQFTKP